MVIFSQLRERYPEDPTIISIVRAGEEICTYSATPTEETSESDSILEQTTPEP